MIVAQGQVMSREVPKFVRGEYPRRILDNLSTAVIVLDEDLRVVFMNSAAEILFAISLRQALGLDVAQVLGTESEMRKGFTRCILDGHSYTERETPLALPHGSAITVDLTVTTIKESELPVELLIELRQVDHRVQIAREKHLISQYNTGRALVRTLAHEIKNPLGGIRGAAQLLRQELGSQELKEYTDIVIREADRLRKLVDSMLGPIALPHPKAVNIHEVLEQVRILIEAQVRGDVCIQRDYDPSIPSIEADRDQLVQAVLNVVGNAVLAVDGHGTITLRSRVARQQTIGRRRNRMVARIEIIDDGPGIPEDMLERIFMPMITGRVDGTGLGLAIAQNLINQHDGLIECVSKPGETIFTILLPLEGKDA